MGVVVVGKLAQHRHQVAAPLPTVIAAVTRAQLPSSEHADDILGTDKVFDVESKTRSSLTQKHDATYPKA